MIKQNVTNIAVARGSRQLNRACKRSPCAAMSPTTDCIFPATILSRSYLTNKNDRAKHHIRICFFNPFRGFQFE